MNKFEAFLAKLWKDKLSDFVISLIVIIVALAYGVAADYFYHQYLNAHGFWGKALYGYFALDMLNTALQNLQNAKNKDR